MIREMFQAYRSLSGMPSAILVVGDVMLDRHIYCDVVGISPEDDLAPKLIERYTIVKPGGAANVAANLGSIGADVTLVGVIGNDSSGETLKGMCPKCILTYDEGRDTTAKTRIITSRGRHIGRIDKEVCTPLGGNVLANVIDAIRQWVKKNPGGLIIISDYEKGVICSEIICDIQVSKCPYIVGAKSKDMNRYGQPNVIVCNMAECNRATSHGKTEWMVVTNGKEGCIVTGHDHTERVGVRAREVGDPTGCGDAFLAAFALGFVLKWPMPLPARLGNAAGAVTYDHVGVHSVTPEQLATELDSFNY